MSSKRTYSILPGALRPDFGSWPSLRRLRVHTQWTHRYRYVSSRRVIGPMQRQQTPLKRENNHVLCGIQTHNSSKQAMADPRLKPLGQWDLHIIPTKTKIRVLKTGLGVVCLLDFTELETRFLLTFLGINLH